MIPTFNRLQKKTHVANHPLFKDQDSRIKKMRDSINASKKKAEDEHELNLMDIFSAAKQIGLKPNDRSLNAFIQQAAITAQESLNILNFPLPPKISYNNSKKVKYAKHDDSQVVSAEILFNVRIGTASGAVRQALLPILVVRSNIVPPSTILFEDKMHVLAQSTVDHIIQRNTSYALQPMRKMYAPPLRDEELDVAVQQKNEIGYQPREVQIDANYNRRTYRKKDGFSLYDVGDIVTYKTTFEQEPVTVRVVDKILMDDVPGFEGLLVGSKEKRLAYGYDDEIINVEKQESKKVAKKAQTLFYDIGDVITYETTMGRNRTVVVTNKFIEDEDSDEEQSGFEGILTKSVSKEKVWGWDSQITNVEKWDEIWRVEDSENLFSSYEEAFTAFEDVHQKEIADLARDTKITVEDAKDKLAPLLIQNVLKELDIEKRAKKAQTFFTNEPTSRAYSNIVNNEDMYNRAKELAAGLNDVTFFAKALKEDPRFSNVYDTTTQVYGDFTQSHLSDPYAEGTLKDDPWSDRGYMNPGYIAWDEIANALLSEGISLGTVARKKSRVGKENGILEIIEIFDNFYPIEDACSVIDMEGWDDETIREAAEEAENMGIISHEDLIKLNECLSRAAKCADVTDDTVPGKLFPKSVNPTEDTLIGQPQFGLPNKYTSTGPTDELYRQIMMQPMIMEQVKEAFRYASLEDQISVVSNAIQPLTSYVDVTQIDWENLVTDLEVALMESPGEPPVQAKKIAKILCKYLEDGMKRTAQLDPREQKEFKLQKHTPSGYDTVLGDMVQAEEEGLDTFPRSYAHVEKNYILKRVNTCKAHQWMNHLVNDGFVLNPYGMNRGRMRVLTQERDLPRPKEGRKMGKDLKMAQSVEAILQGADRYTEYSEDEVIDFWGHVNDYTEDDWEQRDQDFGDDVIGSRIEDDKGRTIYVLCQTQTGSTYGVEDPDGDLYVFPENGLSLDEQDLMEKSGFEKLPDDYINTIVYK